MNELGPTEMYMTYAGISYFVGTLAGSVARACEQENKECTTRKNIATVFGVGSAMHLASELVGSEQGAAIESTLRIGMEYTMALGGLYMGKTINAIKAIPRPNKQTLTAILTSYRSSNFNG